MYWILKLIRSTGNQWRLAGAFLTLLLSKLLFVLSPVVFGHLVDRVTNEDVSLESVFVSLLALVIGYSLMDFFNVLFDEVRTLLALPITQSIRAQLEKKCLQAINRTGKIKTGDNSGKAGLISRAAWNVETIFNVGVFGIFPSFLEFLMAVVILWVSVGWPFALILLIVTFGYSAYTGRIVNKQNQLYQGRLKADNLIIQFLEDSLRNQEVVQAYSKSDKELRLLDSIQQQYKHKWRAQQRHLSITKLIQSLILSVGMLSVLVLSLYRMKNGDFSVGQFVIVALYMLQASAPLNSVSLLYTAFMQATIQIREVKMAFNLSDIDLSNIVDISVRENPEFPSFRDIQLKEISLKSDTDASRFILNDIDLTFKAGDNVAFVGKSGSGKSTLASIIAGLSEQTGGEVFVNDKPAEADFLNDLSNIVSQEPFLFQRSIRANITYDFEALKEEELKRLIQMCQLDELIEKLPNGLDYVIGSSGGRLSGGEKQRVSIARAFAHPKPVMIFDEATRQLDALTEHKVFDNILHELHNFLFIVISHRLDNLRKFDQIVFFEQGKILAKGTHDELYRGCKPYKELYDAGLAQQEDNGGN